MTLEGGVKVESQVRPATVLVVGWAAIRAGLLLT